LALALVEELMEDAPKPKRRVRYKGTHPRKFHEKYKELNPEKYSEDVAKIMERGTTPAGMHRPICVDEILTVLSPKPGETALDATMGYGGHSRALLEKILPGGKLLALDQDSIERPKTEERLRRFLSDGGFEDSSLVVGAINFSEAWNFARSRGIGYVDMVLADLGLSSMQIDTPERGFSFKVEAPFDLRMNPENPAKASDLVRALAVQDIAQMLVENADEPHAEQIAQALAQDRPQTTTEVADCVRRVMKKWSKKTQEREGDTPIRRVFQAFRIAVNDEFGVLDTFLGNLPRLLKPGGRVAILSFHSGEDRRVKKAFQAHHRDGVYSDISPDPLRASPAEQRANPRASSAKLRWAIRG
jgi:16S rRNA (cytosine1402-N4)-methyltransferase